MTGDGEDPGGATGGGGDPAGSTGENEGDGPPAPNRNVLWARALVDELAAAGVDAVAFAPGSRSTPLVVAAHEHPDLATLSHLDERSAAFFALGRGRRTGEATALVCTSGTAAANFHPAVIEADQARVPLVVLTADRPPELRDSGANQTIDQEKLYGDAVRWYRDLPEPEPVPRKFRRLRTDAARAVARAVGTPAGPVHLNVPFRKPLEPVRVEGDVPADLRERAPLAVDGRAGPFVSVTPGTVTADPDGLDRIARRLADADRVLVVAGPADPPVPDGEALAALARTTGAPLLADPLSGLRFGDAVAAPDVAVCGGYDGYLAGGGPGGWPDPDAVVRVGASPTSKPLRKYLRDADADQFLVDPAAGWREAEFTATDLDVGDPSVVARDLAGRLSAAAPDPESGAAADWRARWERAERIHWAVHGVDGDAEGEEGPPPGVEGRVLGTVAAAAPDPATVFVSNSMPVRDLDRFGRPRGADLTVLGNRGASGIDGVVSTALGAGHATEDPLTLVVGDLAYYHDSNGLLALERVGVDATVVLVDNDGGGIFHKLPIEDFDPPFTEAFRTPHGLDFEPTGDLYGLDFRRVHPADLRSAYRESVGTSGTDVLAVEFDARESHRTREDLAETVRERIAAGE